MRIFFSYPHDGNAKLVELIRGELEARGHAVWMDANRIKTGDDWRGAITQGIVDSERVVAFLSRHGTRDSGICLNEIAIALAEKGEHLVMRDGGVGGRGSGAGVDHAPWQNRLVELSG